MTKLGTITIGQSPRIDLVPELKKLIARSIDTRFEIMERGALDDLNLLEIKRLKPSGGEEILVTRMSNGTEVTVGKKSIIPRMQDRISELNAENVDLVTLLCSGTFPEFESKAPLVNPGKLVSGMLSSISIQGKLGVFLPSEDQINQVTRELKDLGFQTVCVGASPYSKNQGVIRKAAQIIKERSVDLVLMHCFGYSVEMKKVVEETTEKPVILVRSLLAQALSELFC